MRTFFLVVVICLPFIMASRQIDQSVLTVSQYFSTKTCFHEQTSLNYMFARDIDINAYKYYEEGYGDHSQVIPTYLEQDDYLTGIKLGNGKFSDVYLGYDKKQQNKKVVIKILRPNKIEKIQREISILTKVDSIENISHLYGVAVDKEFQVPSLIFEYMEGKTLRYQIERLNEIDISYYSYLLIEVIAQSHKLGILHKDIKAANIIINHEKRKLKLIDWGLSDVYYPNNIIFTKIGTISYKAPELIMQEAYNIHFSPAVDVWAVGVCMVAMMYDRIPLFSGQSAFHTMMDIIEIFGYKDVFRLSSYAGIDLNPKIYTSIQQNQKKYTKSGKKLNSLIKKGQEKYANPLGVDLLNKMLKIIPSERISAEEALKHPYFDSVRDIIKNERNTNQE